MAIPPPQQPTAPPLPQQPQQPQQPPPLPQQPPTAAEELVEGLEQGVQELRAVWTKPEYWERRASECSHGAEKKS